MKLKHLFFLLLLLGTIWLGTYTYKSNLLESRCNTPTYYSLGTIDAKFKIPQGQALTYAKEAADIWNKGSGYNLLEYKPGAELTVNMVYDERQSILNQINSQQNSLSNSSESLKDQIASYNAAVKNFQDKLNDYNDQVRYWNSHGGAPEDEYNKLRNEYEALRKEAGSLNSLAKQLNLNAQDYNLKIGELNQSIQSFNENLQKKPEEGLYIPNENKIEIFLDVNDSEIVHTVAHEFGHALGLDHVNDENAIMYPYTSSALKLSSEDLQEVDTLCKTLKVQYEMLNMLYYVQNLVRGILQL